jgi:hypothetical protein
MTSVHIVTQENEFVLTIELHLAQESGFVQNARTFTSGAFAPPRPSFTDRESIHSAKEIEEVVQLAMKVTDNVDRRWKQQNIVFLIEHFHELEENANDGFLWNWTPRVSGDPLPHA